MTLVAPGQKEKKLTVHSGLFLNWPVYDARFSSNSNGAGLNIDFYLNCKSKIKPKFEVNYNLFMTQETYVVDIDGHTTPDKNGTACILIGSVYHLSKKTEVSFNAGPCFIQSKIHPGIKPSLAIYPDERKIIKLELSLSNIFQPNSIGGNPFGFISFGLGIKLY